MRKRLKYLILLFMILAMVFLTGCDFVTDFLQKPIGYIIIGGLTLFLVFKYGGKKN